ncbi:MAG: hypothetical protein ACI4TD_02515 [Phocaeicola sp.]
MNKRIMNYAAVGAYALGLFGLNSCLKVDDTYDLNKDIDMTITVGGDLTLPGSNTERMLLGDLLELEDDGIIKADETTGDYALVQKGESSTVESSGKCKISKYFYKTRFLGLKTLIFCAVYH